MTFPSPAADFAEGRLSLDEHLIENKDATFFFRMSGGTLAGFGIHDGDLLVVDRAVEPTDLNVVVAVIDGEFLIRQICYAPEGVRLRTDSPGQSDIVIGAGQELTVWGVVRHSIHRV